MVGLIAFALAISSAHAGQQRGMASYYSKPQATACGPRFDPKMLVAAHRTIACGTKVKVTNQCNGRSVLVTIGDHGPNVRGRIIDVSHFAAELLDMMDAGVVPVAISW